MKRILILVAATVLLAGCAQALPLPTEPEPYGFWGGLWHGLIFFFSFIGSVFNDDIAIYAVNNNGGWYDFGFFLGICVVGGGGSSASR